MRKRGVEKYTAQVFVDIICYTICLSKSSNTGRLIMFATEPNHYQSDSMETSAFNQTPFAGKKDSEHSAFLSSLNRLGDSLALDQDWADMYDDMAGLWHFTMDEFLQLLSTAPDYFSAGVVFGKLNLLQSATMRHNRPIEISDAAYVSKQMNVIYKKCMEKMSGHGEWSIDHEDLAPYCETIDEMNEMISEMKTLLACAPNEFCQGVIFGKITVLLDIQVPMGVTRH